MSAEVAGRIAAYLRHWEGGCAICDYGIDPYTCAGCQKAPTTHEFDFEPPDGSFTSGTLCLECYSALAEQTGAVFIHPVFEWISIRPQVECVHLHLTAGWRGTGYCRDCGRRGPFQHQSPALHQRLAQVMSQKVVSLERRG